MKNVFNTIGEKWKSWRSRQKELAEKGYIEEPKELPAQASSDAENPESPGSSPDQPPPQKPETFFSKYKWGIIAAGALVIVTTVSALFPVIEDHSRERKAEALAASLILDDSSFDEDSIVYLRGAKWLDENDIWAGLTVEPWKTFSITPEADDSFGVRFEDTGSYPFAISFTEPFGLNSVSLEVNYHPLTVSVSNLNPDKFSVRDPILLAFSQPVRGEDIQPYLALEPYAPFELRVRDDLVWIEPYEPLLHSTEYTITLAEGLPSYNGRYSLYEDTTLTLRTRKQGFDVTLTNPLAKMLTAADDFTLTFDTLFDDTAAVDSLPMSVDIYKFPNLDDYLANSERLVTEDAALTDLEHVGEYTHELTELYSSFVAPNPGNGAYIAHMSVTDPVDGGVVKFRKAFAVTDLSVYAQTSGTQTLVWVNSSQTGEALPGYTVAFSKGGSSAPLAEAVTDVDGVAVVSYVEPDADSYYYRGNTISRTVTLRDSEGKTIYADNTGVLNTYNQPLQANRYYSYFQLDRALYRPTDEINFWGYVRAYRKNRDPLPSHVRVIFGEGSSQQEMELPLREDGAFQGKMDIEAIRSSHYNMRLILPSSSTAAVQEEGSDRTLHYVYLQVKDFQKPLYTIETANDKDFYYPGEDVTVEVKPTFYDGTPMPYYDLEFSVRESYYGDYGESQVITTDGDGVARITFPADYQARVNRAGWLPASNRYRVVIAGDGENITAYGEYRYLPSDTAAAASIENADGDKLNLTIETTSVDFSVLKTLEDLNRVNAEAYYADYYGYNDTQFAAMKGAPRDIPVKVTASFYYYEEKREWRKNEKTGVNSYNSHWEWKEGKETYDIVTSGGKAEIEDFIKFSYDKDRYLSIDVRLEYTDTAGRNIATSIYWYNGRYHPYEDGEDNMPQGYNFILTDQDGKNALGTYYKYMSYNEAAFGAGDTMNFTLHLQDKPAQNKGRILWTKIQGEIVDRGVLTGDVLRLNQGVENANSFNLVAAYFDGTTVYPIRNTVVSLDKSSLELNVEVTPDKKSYQPGETVNLSVKVTDKNGRGVAGTTCLSIVDESIFALQEQYIDVLYDLYQDFYFNHYYILKYATGVGDYVQDYGPGMGDGGKGDGDNLSFLDRLRKNFKDTALFQLVTTDAGGAATTTFTLPDNVTSWRITGVSIGDNLYAGQSKANFVSTMPFFVSPVISSKYIQGDDIAMLIQGHGVILDQSSEITYAVNIKGDGVDETKTLKHKAYQPCQLNFGKLPEGEYTVTASASAGAYRDSVELPLAVIGSNLELVVNREIDLSRPIDLKAVRYPVTVTFYDKDHEAYFGSVSSLLTHYCMWASQRMSRFVAKRALTEHMAPEEIPQHIQTGNDDAADMQNPDGGIGYGPGEPSDPAVTTKVLIVAKDQFNLDAMTVYFNEILALTRDPVETASCYLGLAVIGEPVGEELLKRIADPKTTAFERAYYIAGLAYLGDTDNALSLYEEHITPHMANEGAGRFYKPADKNEDDSLTASAWMAASVLHHTDADGISLYFAKNPWRISTLFECMAYVTHYDKEVLSSSLTYQAGGKEVTVNLGLQGRKTIAFNKSQFDSLKIVNPPQNISARAYFIGEPEEADIHPSEKVSIRKEITELENNRYQVTLTMDFTDEAPLGVYDISEWVPSNLRLYAVDANNRGYGHRWWYSYSTEGQKIYFRVYRNQSTEQIILRYTAQKTYDAEAVVDSAYIIHGDSGESNFTPRTVLGKKAGGGET